MDQFSVIAKSFDIQMQITLDIFSRHVELALNKTL